MMRKYSITALNDEGSTLYHEITDKAYYIIPDLMYHISELTSLLISGKAKTILIEEVKGES